MNVNKVIINILRLFVMLIDVASAGGVGGMMQCDDGVADNNHDPSAAGGVDTEDPDSHD